MTLARKQQLFFDAIEESIGYARLTYERIVQAVTASAREGPIDRHRLQAIVLDAWTIVDIAKRLQALLQNTPGLTRTHVIEVFLRQLAEVEEFRHYIQHLDQ